MNAVYHLTSNARLNYLFLGPACPPLFSISANGPSGLSLAAAVSIPTLSLVSAFDLPPFLPSAGRFHSPQEDFSYPILSALHRLALAPLLCSTGSVVNTSLSLTTTDGTGTGLDYLLLFHFQNPPLHRVTLAHGLRSFDAISVPACTSPPCILSYPIPFL